MPIVEARLLQFPLPGKKKFLKVNDYRLTLWGGNWVLLVGKVRKATDAKLSV